MKLATERTHTPDGRLLVVSRDQARAIPASGVASTLQEALDRWDEVRGALEDLYVRLNDGRVDASFTLDPSELSAPLPRAWQWLDASVFPSHGELMQKAFDLPPIEMQAPLMYQGMSHQFIGPFDDVAFPSEEDGIDFEAEIGVITGKVPMATPASRALENVRLIVQINDWSLRKIAPVEMKTGFGWIQAKPACSMAPIAITPDELGRCWSEGRIEARVEVRRNDELFGSVPTTEMEFGFQDLIAHASRTRSLCAGTIIGSGTVSSRRFREVGSCCIAERRALEMMDRGAPHTPFLRFGERVRVRTVLERSAAAVFGDLDQRVVALSTQRSGST